LASLPGVKMNLPPMQTMDAGDAGLVTESLTGNREAFGRTVLRDQTLIY
jgi:hypothetical protein